AKLCPTLATPRTVVCQDSLLFATKCVHIHTYALTHILIHSHVLTHTHNHTHTFTYTFMQSHMLPTSGAVHFSGLTHTHKHTHTHQHWKQRSPLHRMEICQKTHHDSLSQDLHFQPEPH
ncbi:unnamed protein product, partial [Rangifer tarandus platyrhynchus]